MRTSEEKIRFVVCDRNSDRDAIMSMTAPMGISNVETCDDVRSLGDALERGIVDLLLYDYDASGDELLEMTRTIRRKTRGRNPFVIIMATLEEGNVEAIKRLMDAGVDDLIIKPFSSERLIENLFNFTHSRRPFAVSHDYIGPTRRNAKRDNEEPSGLTHVPNTLRSKLTQEIEETELQRMIDKALIEIEDKQRDASGRTIAELATKIAFEYGAPGGEVQTKASLERLHTVATELYERSNSPSTQHVASLAKMMLVLIDRVLASPPGKASTNVKLVDRLGQAVRHALTVEQDAAGLLQDIVNAVAGFTR